MNPSLKELVVGHAQTADEAADAAHVARLASWHGVHSHAGIKALHLDHHLGSPHGH